MGVLNGIAVMALVVCATVAVAADDLVTRIDIAPAKVGLPPADFEFALWGNGDLGRWRVVNDPTATGGLAIEHVSTDTQEDRFPFAIYRPLVTENVEIDVHFNIVSGTMQSAG